MFYCQFSEISQNTFYTKHLWTTASEFVTEMLIFRSSRSLMFFKLSVLKNFAILEPLSNNKVADLLLHLRRLLLNFCGSKYLFAAEYGIYCWQSHRFRSSHQRCSVRKGVLRNFANFTRKHFCQGLFFNKVAGLRPATLLKKRIRHRCFPVNFAKFLRTPFLQNTFGRLLLPVFVLDSFENTS